MSENLPLVSLIFAARNEGIQVKNTIESVLQAKTYYPYEIIMVDDASTDGSCDFIENYEDKERFKLLRGNGYGVAKARNLGADHAKGYFFVFCDSHIVVEDWWLDRLLEPIENGVADATNPGIGSINKPYRVGYGAKLNEGLHVKWRGWKSGPFQAGVLIGICFAIKRDVFLDIGGYDREFRVWGRADVDISIKLWLFGYKGYIQPSTKVLHLFRRSRPYKLAYQDVYFNLLRMAYNHFNEERIEKVRKQIVHSNPSMIESMVLASNVLEQRKAYFERRKYDDDWYFSTFRINF